AAAELAQLVELTPGAVGGGEVEGGDDGVDRLAHEVAERLLPAVAVGVAELGAPAGGAAILEDRRGRDRALLDDAEQALVGAVVLGPREGLDVVAGEVAPALDRVLLLELGQRVGGRRVELARRVLALALGRLKHL